MIEENTIDGDARGDLLFVLGVAHSGAHVLARALVDAGAILAADASADPSDYGAPDAISRLNTEMLASIGVSLPNPGPLVVGRETLAEVRLTLTARLLRAYRRRAAVLLKKAVTPDTTTVIHDIQIALLLPFWRTVLAECGIAARFAVVQRNPIALADLARQHSRQPVRRGWFLWQYLTIEMLEAAPDATIVAALELIRDPAAVAQGLLPGTKPRIVAPSDIALEEHPRDTDTFDDVPLFANQGHHLHALLERWPGLTIADRTAAVGELRAGFDDAMLVGALGRPPRVVEITPEPEEPTEATRPLILHYHLFKNAGSSIDAMLRKNFGDRWTEHEFPRKTPDKNKAALIAFLEEHGAIDAFSSHTMLLPIPGIRGRSIIPIIFVRHPLLRIRSAYGFERRQDAETKGAKLAKEHDFAGYVAALLNEPRNRQARNFQTIRFAFGTPGDPTRELERAMTTVANLPFVGLVEHYDRSVARLCDLVRPRFPDFEQFIVRRNAEGPADTRTIEDRIKDIERELGPEVFEQLTEANRDDIALFRRVEAMYLSDGK